MNEKEVIKTHITTIQALIIAFLSAIFAVFGYVIIHIDDDFSMPKLVFGGVAFGFLVVGFAALIVIYLKLTKIKE